MYFANRRDAVAWHRRSPLPRPDQPSPTLLDNSQYDKKKSSTVDGKETWKIPLICFRKLCLVFYQLQGTVWNQSQVHLMISEQSSICRVRLRLKPHNLSPTIVNQQGKFCGQRQPSKFLVLYFIESRPHAYVSPTNSSFSSQKLVVSK